MYGCFFDVVRSFGYGCMVNFLWLEVLVMVDICSFMYGCFLWLDVVVDIWLIFWG